LKKRTISDAPASAAASRVCLNILQK